MNRDTIIPLCWAIQSERAKLDRKTSKGLVVPNSVPASNLPSDPGDSDDRRGALAVAAAAAFVTYFCMYAFRKPFSAATLTGQTISLGGWIGAATEFDLKTVLVLAQLAGYMSSKFLGIKFVSEMPRRRRAVAILVLIGFAELALLGYAIVPVPAKILMLFLNGLPLGMVFGLVLAYLEGRRVTEAMTAVLCASFISSSGVVKTVGTKLMEDYGVSEFLMPFLTGLIFLLPLLMAVYVLDRTPEPNHEDVRQRTRRRQMDRTARWEFMKAYFPGLVLLVGIHMAVTVVRSVRDDFGVEIWQGLGVARPEVFALSETSVAFVVTAISAAAILIRGNVRAFLSSLLLTAGGFLVIGMALLLQSFQAIGPFPFMVACGIGLYVPYVVFHTTVFERLIAASRRTANLGFLMYVADAMGYFAYVGYLIYKVRLVENTATADPEYYLNVFRWIAMGTVLGALVSLALAAFYFQRRFRRDGEPSMTAMPQLAGGEG